jgi:hypothetical protein
VVTGEYDIDTFGGHDSAINEFFPKALTRPTLKRRHCFQPSARTLVNDKPLGGVLAHAICARAFAIEQLLLALGGGCIGQWLKYGLPQRGQQGGGGFVNLKAVCLQRRGRVGPRAGVAVFQAGAPGLGCFRNGEPLQKPLEKSVEKKGQTLLLVGANPATVFAGGCRLKKHRLLIG